MARPAGRLAGRDYDENGLRLGKITTRMAYVAAAGGDYDEKGLRGCGHGFLASGIAVEACSQSSKA